MSCLIGVEKYPVAISRTDLSIWRDSVFVLPAPSITTVIDLPICALATPFLVPFQLSAARICGCCIILYYLSTAPPVSIPLIV